MNRTFFADIQRRLLSLTCSACDLECRNVAKGCGHIAFPRSTQYVRALPKVFSNNASPNSKKLPYPHETPHQKTTQQQNIKYFEYIFFLHTHTHNGRRVFLFNPCFGPHFSFCSTLVHQRTCLDMTFRLASVL